MKIAHIGSNFDDFLREEGIHSQAQAMAIKRVLAYQISEEIKRKNLSKSELAVLMKTSRAALDRLLDSFNKSVTLATLERAANALGKKLVVELT
jgi:predicted XRE-type DNA-binding protein